VHGGNFVAPAFRVKPHGAILGMQMQCNRTGVAALPHIPSFRGDANGSGVWPGPMTSSPESRQADRGSPMRKCTSEVRFAPRNDELLTLS